jgi:hypothetical protein
MDTWTTVLFGALQSAVARLGLVVPRLLALGVWSVVGWGVAALARPAGVRLLQALAFDPRCLRWGVTPALGRLGISGRPRPQRRAPATGPHWRAAGPPPAAR